METEKGLAKVRWREKLMQWQRYQERHPKQSSVSMWVVGPISVRDNLYFPSMRVTDRYVKLLPDPLDSTGKAKLQSFNPILHGLFGM